MISSNKKGFTLVELVVVIAIIGVLAAILVPSMMGYVKKSRLKTANANAKTAYNVVADVDAECEGMGHPVDWENWEQEFTISEVDMSSVKTLNADGSNVDEVFEYEVARALVPNGKESGYVHIGGEDINVDSAFFVHWEKTSDDDIYGQYPQAIKTYEQCTSFGEWQDIE